MATSETSSCTDLSSSAHFFLLIATEVLSLFNNTLTGTIPSEISLLANLGTLVMSLRISRLSTRLSHVSRLAVDFLLLYGNNFTGPFTCPAYVETCGVSCDFVDEECRVLN